MPQLRPGVVKRINKQTKQWGGETKNKCSASWVSRARGREMQHAVGIGFLVKEAERRRERAGAKVSRQRGLLTSAWRGRRQKQAPPGRKSRREGPGPGRSAAQKGQRGPSGWETRGTCRRPQRALELGVGEDHAGRAAAGFPQAGREAAAGVSGRQRRFVSLSKGSLRRMARRRLFNGLPFWAVVEESVTERPGAFHGQGQKAGVVVRRYLKGIALP